MKRPKVEMPTDEEEAAIQRGIAQDPDSPELTEEFFANARPASEVLPPDLYAELTRHRLSDEQPGQLPVESEAGTAAKDAHPTRTRSD